MTVCELVKALAEYPGDAEVVLSRDSEGNGASPLDEVTEEIYQPRNTWSGDLVTEDDAVDGDTACVVLWPVN